MGAKKIVVMSAEFHPAEVIQGFAEALKQFGIVVNVWHNESDMALCFLAHSKVTAKEANDALGYETNDVKDSDLEVF